MASPCEVHVADASRVAARHLIRSIAAEARRIEGKFSRYLEGNIVDRINRSNGDWTNVDAETARLIDYAEVLHRLSRGRFDVTSGILRRAWKFDGGSAVPDADVVDSLLGRVGWHRVRWERPRFRLQPGMQIDFGGLGKEYAVDRAAAIAAGLGANCMINFGGDLIAQGPGKGSSGWIVGIESLSRSGCAGRSIRIKCGALATSGDSYRFLAKDGKRYGHILDPRTGWPVDEAPHSVTVAASTCTEAGMLATFAMLHGGKAEAFLESQNVEFWLVPSSLAR